MNARTRRLAVYSIADGVAVGAMLHAAQTPLWIAVVAGYVTANLLFVAAGGVR